MADFALETVRSRRVGQVEGHKRSVMHGSDGNVMRSGYTDVSPHNRTTWRRGFGKTKTVLDKIKDSKRYKKVW